MRRVIPRTYLLDSRHWHIELGVAQGPAFLGRSDGCLGWVVCVEVFSGANHPFSSFPSFKNDLVLYSCPYPHRFSFSLASALTGSSTAQHARPTGCPFLGFIFPLLLASKFRCALFGSELYLYGQNGFDRHFTSRVCFWPYRET